jgi:hypothetical protein
MRLALRLLAPLLALCALAAAAETPAGPPRFAGERNSTNDLGPADPAPASLPATRGWPVVVAPEIRPVRPGLRPWPLAPVRAPHPPRRRPGGDDPLGPPGRR